MGRWTLREALGAGAFGSTWRADDKQGLTGALKLLDRPPGGEFRALAAVSHPAVVAVLDSGGGASPFMVMEMAEGETLTERMKHGPLDEGDILLMVGVLADALAAVHHVGIAHGDIKPDNIITSTSKMQTWLVDFGESGATCSGGTTLYAAPERLTGATNTTNTTNTTNATASDIYALGLVAWQILHRSLPWDNRGPAEALMMRCYQSPKPEHGPLWFRELLSRMLSVNPLNRPRATEVCDVLAAHGVQSTSVDIRTLRQRARKVRISRPEQEEAIGQWLSKGGSLALTGPDGFDVSSSIERVVQELQAQARPWIQLRSGGRSWSAISQALTDPRLPRGATTLPRIVDPEQRAWAAAVALEQRSESDLAVIVDEIDDLDEGSTQVLRNLALRGHVQILVGARKVPEWIDECCALRALDADGMGTLISEMLSGTSCPEALTQCALKVSGGNLGIAVEFILSLVQQGALRFRAQRWLVNEQCMYELLEDGLNTFDTLPAPAPGTANVGALIALSNHPVAPSLAARLLRISHNTCVHFFNLLEKDGFIQQEDYGYRCVSIAARSRLLDACPDLASIHQMLAQILQSQPECSMAQLGWHVSGSGDAAWAARIAPSAITAAMEMDVEDAVRLANALWAIAPVTAIEALRVSALVASGRVDEALEFGEALLNQRDLQQEDVPLLLALSRVHTNFREDHGQAWACIQSARIALADAPPSMALLATEAQANFRAERLEKAIQTAKEAISRGEPEDLEEHDCWLKVWGVWAQCLLRQGNVNAGLKLLEPIPGVTEGTGRPAHALLDGIRSRLLWHAGQIREAGVVLERASTRNAGLPALERARMLNNAGLAAYLSGDRIGALTCWEKALFINERLNVQIEQIRVQNNLCVGYREAGRWERSRQAGEWVVQKARSMKLPEYEAMAAGNLGDLHMARGQTDKGTEWFNRAQTLADRHGLTGEQVEMARRWAELAVHKNDESATSLATVAQQLALVHDAHFEASRATILLAVCHARAGRLDTLDALIAEAMVPLKREGASGELADVRIWAAEAYLEVGRLKDALTEAISVETYAEEVGHVQLRIRAEKLIERARPKRTGNAQSLRCLLQIAEFVARETSLDESLMAITEMALNVFDGDRAYLLLQRNNALEVVASQVRNGLAIGEPTMELVRRAVSTGCRIIAADLKERSELLATTSRTNIALRSVMCVPIVYKNTVMGAIYVDSRTISEQELSDLDLLMRALASHAAMAVANHRQNLQVTQRARRAEEMLHDLNNYLMVVPLLTSQLCTFVESEPELSRDLEDIVTATNQARFMATRFVKGEPSIRCPLDLSALVRRSVRLYQHSARNKGVQLELYTAASIQVSGDPEDLKRVIDNLLVNAVKFSPPNTTVSIRVEEQGTNRGRVSIRDQGPGIPPDYIDKVFDWKTQIPGTPSGNGMGLAIVRRLVNEHNGTLQLEQLEGNGSLFWFELPCWS